MSRFARAFRSLVAHGRLRDTARALAKSLRVLDFHVFTRTLEPLSAASEQLQFDSEIVFRADALERLREIRRGQHHLPSEFFRDETSQIRACFLAEAQGKPVGVVWACDGERPMLVLGPNDIENSGVITVPEYRGRGIYRGLGRFKNDWLAAHGYRRMFAVVSGDNPTMLKITAEFGYEHVAVLRRRSLFGPRYYTAEHRVR